MVGISIVAIAASALLVSVVIVAFDPRHRRRIIPLGHLGLALCIALPVVRFAAYIFAGGTPPPMEAIEAIDHWHDRLFAENILLGGLTLIPAFLLIVLLFILTPISIALAYIAAPVAVIYLGIVVVIATPHLVMVPAYATRHVLHGTGRILVLPWLAVLSVIYFLTRPRVVGDLRREYKKQVQSAAEEAERVRHVHEALEQEASRVFKTRWWKPDISIIMSTRHYQKLAEHLRALAGVATAAEEHFKKTTKMNDDERS